ncbi:Proteasome subunit beta type-4 [Sesamum angolense]|uniref:Proteasome subunit beta n=1 Tax=Sesamum angolense TaxID=2727404 RepID=A0AAE1WLE0_9LAMI|nr:Proteasome subunit beta type-4 [Sesamum angolense]
MNVADSAPAANNLLASNADSQRTLYPYVTGTSVVGIKYKDGILLAADMGGSYGSNLRYKTVERLKSVGKHSIIGASGEISDFQEIMRYLDELILYDNMWDDGNSLGPKEVNMIGVHYEDDHVATGFGNHLARPILRDEWHENLTFEEGVKLLEKCMRVLLYRDRSAVNKLQVVILSIVVFTLRDLRAMFVTTVVEPPCLIARITEDGVTVFPPYSLKTFWNFNAFQNPTVGAEGSWALCAIVYNKFSYQQKPDRSSFVDVLLAQPGGSTRSGSGLLRTLNSATLLQFNYGIKDFESEIIVSIPSIVIILQ